eukprot:15366118-Ditylum_brightwellii.AAC.1
MEMMVSMMLILHNAVVSSSSPNSNDIVTQSYVSTVKLEVVLVLKVQCTKALLRVLVTKQSVSIIVSRVMMHHSVLYNQNTVDNDESSLSKNNDKNYCFFPFLQDSYFKARIE